MTRQIITLLFCIGSILALAQTPKPPCHNLDFLVKQTVEAINKRDVDFYRSLIDYDTVLSMCNETATNSKEKALCELLKEEQEAFMKACQSNFLELKDVIDNKLSTGKWTLDLLDYKIYDEQKEPEYTNYILHVNVEAGSANYQLSVNAVKYKNCYYIFEPVMPYFFKKSQ